MTENVPYVFHYTTARTALNYILKNMTLKLGSLAAVNDLKESKYRDFTLYSRGMKSVFEFKDSYFDELTQDLANNSYVLCCGLNGKDLHDGALRHHMWANYARKHTGVCLVLNAARLQEGIERAAGENPLYSGEVSYHEFDDRNNPSWPAYNLYLEQWLQDKEGFFDAHVKNYYKGLFFSKGVDWRDERECRWVIRSRAGRPFFVDISNALDGIVVGGNISDRNFNAIREICEGSNIDLRAAVWNNHGYLSENLIAGEESVNISGSYSLGVPCKAVFRKATSGRGKQYSYVISNEGKCIFVPDNNPEYRKNLVESLGGAVQEVGEPYEVKGFSAARLSEVDKKPLMFEFVGDVLKLHKDEEQPYYGLEIRN
ncbi:DUF2971 domain-containing protein [Pseudomonas sp. NPDC088414]|uniref:DUF2971 domain-containing protein n=1 Tax=Pseudomonas sp. NPDC088414 TaxID=3364454 RepID=UPI0037F1E456